ncbi:MAG: S1C family serine protease [Vicinamibacterales bacterium]
MSDHARLCPSCGRRVPGAVAKCRCGVVLPAQDGAAVAAPRPSPILVYVVLIAAVAGVGYWTFTRPPATAPDTAASGTFDVAPQPGDPGTTASLPRELSPEQRAWDASARMQDTKAPTQLKEEPLQLSDPALAPAVEDMVDRAMPSIVLVETTTGRGSAFYVRHDTLITNVHVVQHDSYVTLRRMDGSSVSARVQTRAPNFDIAVLKVAQASPAQPFLPMGSTSGLKPGQEIIIIGSALGTLQNSVSRGIVSGLRNSGGVTLVQSDAAANPGNSGGPMLDRNGRVIGVLTAGYSGKEGLNFGVSIDHARDILEGRETNLGVGQSGLANIDSAAGAGSESDRRQQLGDQEFTRRIGAAEEVAPQLDQLWQRFRGVCYKSPIRGSYDREWFAVFTPGAIPGDAAAGCIDYFQSMQSEMNKFRDFMRAAVQDARRANVLPGTIRDTLRAKRLQSDAWGR